MQALVHHWQQHKSNGDITLEVIYVYSLSVCFCKYGQENLFMLLLLLILQINIAEKKKKMKIQEILEENNYVGVY